MYGCFGRGKVCEFARAPTRYSCSTGSNHETFIDAHPCTIKPKRKQMITVQLHQLLFDAFHGIHEEEKILGNEYVVDATVEFQEDTSVIHSIHDTVNYTDMYHIIRERMNVPTPLLETVVMD